MDVAKRRTLGKSGLDVSVMGLGGAPLSNREAVIPEQQALDTIQLAYDRGITMFDVSPFYGYGAGEHRMGHVLRQQPRESYVLSSKVGRLLKPTPKAQIDKTIWVETLAFQPVFDYSYDGTLRSVDDSLQRLGVDRIDILHIHDVDHGTHGREGAEKRFSEAMDGSYRALDRLRSEKVISAVGCGVNYTEWAMRFAQAGDFDCFMLAGRYTLMEQEVLDDFFPLCRKRGIGLMLGGVFNSGILATGPKKGAWYNYEPADEKMLERVERARAICADHNVSLTAAAVQFPLGHPVVATVVLGAVSPDQMAANVAAMNEDIPDAVWAELKQEKIIRADAPTPQAG